MENLNKDKKKVKFDDVVPSICCNNFGDIFGQMPRQQTILSRYLFMVLNLFSTFVFIGDYSSRFPRKLKSFCFKYKYLKTQVINRGVVHT